MEKARTKDGVHVVPTAEPNKYSQEQLRLMKTQDAGYLGMKAQAEKRKVEKLQQTLHLIGAPAAERRHVVFVDDEADAKAFDPEEHFDTPAELLGRAFNRPRRAQLAEGPVASGDPQQAAAVARKAERRRASAYKELLQRQARQEALGGATQKMEYQKQVMGNGRKRKLTAAEAGGQNGVYKWKAERKR